MRSVTTTAAVWMVVGLLGAGVAPSSAQSATVPVQLAGTWAFDGTREHALHLAETAFAPVVTALPEILQSFARGRIRAELDPPRRVVVDLTGGRVRVSLAGDRTTTVEGALGSAVTAIGVEDGTRVSTRLSGGWLELGYDGDGTAMRQLLSTEPDGARMHLDYTVTGERLAQPVRYRLDFVHSP